MLENKLINRLSLPIPLRLEHRKCHVFCTVPYTESIVVDAVYRDLFCSITIQMKSIVR